jgi:hypothetical protein
VDDGSVFGTILDSVVNHILNDDGQDDTLGFLRLPEKARKKKYGVKMDHMVDIWSG